jgi:hypothetical protein
MMIGVKLPQSDDGGALTPQQQHREWMKKLAKIMLKAEIISKASEPGADYSNGVVGVKVGGGWGVQGAGMWRARFAAFI